MNESPKLDARMELRLAKADMETLEAIHQYHGTSPQDFARKLVITALTYYRTHGYFVFPIVMYPDPVVGRAAEAAAETEKARRNNPQEGSPYRPLKKHLAEQEAAELKEMAANLPKAKARKSS